MTSAKVAVVNLGCRVNRVELDSMASELVGHGCALVAEADADLVVINTCAVTGEAEKKCRKAIRHAASLPGRPAVVATGCVASLFAGEVAALAPNVVVVPDKSRVVAACLAELGIDASSEGTCARDTVTVTGRARPGIKVQDGCDNRCTYCIVWKARGPVWSMDVDRVVGEVRSLVAAGAGEVVLSGINLGRYAGAGDGGTVGVADLLSTLLSATDVGRIRLSSIEPPDVTDGLLSLMASSEGRIAPFLHIPLQSGCDRTLGDMARNYSTSEYARVVERARASLPQAAIACDLIVGFPGETDDDFEESLSFCRDMRFAKMHVFRYSARPGTPAATFAHQVNPHVKAERGERARELARGMRSAYVSSLVGRDQVVCVESDGRGTTGGLVEALVDRGVEAGRLVGATPRSVLEGDVLDCRSRG